MNAVKGSNLTINNGGLDDASGGGRITGGSYGIRMGYGTVNNGVQGQGTITGTSTGIYAYGTSETNKLVVVNSRGSINGAGTCIDAAFAYITNGGAITASGIAIYSTSDLILVNNGAIGGSTCVMGIAVSGAAHITNSDTHYITGSSNAIVSGSLTENLTIINTGSNAHITISSANGTAITAVHADITNEGTITGGGGGSGIYATGTLYVTNSGSIKGATGITSVGTLTVTGNSGNIEGTDACGIQVPSAGTVVSITNNAAGEIKGKSDGIFIQCPVDIITNVGKIYSTDTGKGIRVDNTLTSLVNSGEITGKGADGHGVYVSNATISNTGGTISGTAANGINATGTLTITSNTGSILGNLDAIIASNATITNSGAITSSIDHGITATGTLTLTNNVTGTISGDSDGINAVGGTITNSGAITGDKGRGIYASGTIAITNNGGGCIAGGGNGITAHIATITNESTAKINSKGAGMGIYVDDTLTLLTNGGEIKGSGYDGHGVGVTNNATIYNTGVIDGPEGDGINGDSAGLIVISLNSGQINGGLDDLGGNGITAGTLTINSNEGDIGGGLLWTGVTLCDGISVSGMLTISGNIGKIDGSNNGIVASAGADITNSIDGTISGLVFGENGNGIVLSNGGTVTNYGTVKGAVGGLIVSNAAAIFTNSGTVDGNVTLDDYLNNVFFIADSIIYGDFDIGGDASLMIFDGAPSGPPGGPFKYAEVTGATNLRLAEVMSIGLPFGYMGEDITLIDGTGGSISAGIPQGYIIGTYEFMVEIQGDQLVAVLLTPPSGPSEKVYYIRATAGAGATISPSGTISAIKGSSRTFTFSAASVMVDGVALSPDDVEKGYYVFQGIISNHTISASGTGPGPAKIYLTVDVTEGKGKAEYSVNEGVFKTYTGPVALNVHDDVVLRSVADKGYAFKGWWNGTISYSDPELTIPNVLSAPQILLYFEKDGSDNTVMLVIAFLLILLFLLLIIILARKKRKKS